MKTILKHTVSELGLIFIILLVSYLYLYLSIKIYNQTIVLPFILSLALAPLLVICFGTVNHCKKKEGLKNYTSLFVIPGALFVYYNIILVSIFNNIFHNQLTSLLYFVFFLPICGYVQIMVNKKIDKANSVLYTLVFSIIMSAYYGYLCFGGLFIE